MIDVATLSVIRRDAPVAAPPHGLCAHHGAALRSFSSAAPLCTATWSVLSL